jgi:hypothetical protein
VGEKIDIGGSEGKRLLTSGSFRRFAVANAASSASRFARGWSLWDERVVRNHFAALRETHLVRVTALYERGFSLLIRAGALLA